MSSDRECCGLSLRTFAMTSTMALCIWMLLSSCLGFWSLSEVKSQAEAIDAESADHEGLLGNAKLTAASLAILFLLLSGYAAWLFFLAGWPHGDRRLPITLHVGYGLVVLLIAWETAGYVMSWVTPADAVEQACKIISVECFDEYMRLKWYSLPIEIIGVLLFIWALGAVHLLHSKSDDAHAPNRKVLDEEDTLAMTSLVPPRQQQQQQEDHVEMSMSHKHGGHRKKKSSSGSGRHHKSHGHDHGHDTHDSHHKSHKKKKHRHH